MANEVRVKMSGELEIKNSDMEVIIKKNGKKLGTVLISKGNIEWLPAGNSVNKFRLGWGRFAEFMSEAGRKVKR
ncbi:hypothetical protein KOI40_01835 [Aestuariicella sp. G3-2]|uniref:hypothetical protein n=1 Tax=Pseudomaricurvus albidus TaxID=2842452 RepID=UPI001C0D8DFF|nr:hypothetical protein [Aestuariicella albida]MBU3068537.1 hypothetical protein [Aestuariicella albida]